MPIMFTKNSSQCQLRAVLYVWMCLTLRPTHRTASSLRPTHGTANSLRPTHWTPSSLRPTHGTANSLRPTHGTVRLLRRTHRTASSLRSADGTAASSLIPVYGTASSLRSILGTASSLRPADGESKFTKTNTWDSKFIETNTWDSKFSETSRLEYISNYNGSGSADDNILADFSETDILVSPLIKTIFHLFILPVAVLGVCSNVLIIVVWSKETKFNPTILLMRSLALIDIFVLVYCSILYFKVTTLGQYYLPEYYLWEALYAYCCVLNVHTTLAVVFTRWLAVHSPLHAKRLLTKRRVIVGYFMMVIWCSVMSLPMWFTYFQIFMDDGELEIGLFFSSRFASEILPIIALVILNISIVYMMCTQRASSSLRQQNTEVRAAQFHRLVTAVVCMSLVTFTTYPLFISVTFSLYFQQYSRSVSLLMLTISHCLKNLNSSINVIFYLLFASRFRQLCRVRFDRCMCCVTIGQEPPA